MTDVVFEGHYVVCDKHLIAPSSMSFAIFCQNYAVTTTCGIKWHHIDSPYVIRFAPLIEQIVEMYFQIKFTTIVHGILFDRKQASINQ